MLITTTPQIEGKKVKGYLGIVSGEAIMGADIFKDLFAGIRNIVGGRAAAYEQELRRAKDIALEEMVENAKALGANAIVGVEKSIGRSSHESSLRPNNAWREGTCLGRHVGCGAIAIKKRLSITVCSPSFYLFHQV